MNTVREDLFCEAALPSGNKNALAMSCYMSSVVALLCFCKIHCLILCCIVTIGKTYIVLCSVAGSTGTGHCCYCKPSYFKWGGSGDRHHELSKAAPKASQ